MKKYSTFRLTKGNLSFLVDNKAMRTIFGFSILTILLFILCIGLGDKFIHPLNVIRVFLGSGTEMDTLIVTAFRLPRIITAVLVGICLAVSGAILQGIIRNPLASPDIIGITGGASVAVVAFLAIYSDSNNALTISINWLPLWAFVGATFIALLIYSLSWKSGVAPVRLVLMGVGLESLTKALTTLFMILGPIYAASQANIWITGSVNGASWANVKVLFPWTVVLLMLSFLFVRKINVQELGDDLATGVGSFVQKDRFILLLISTALTGLAVSFAGGIGFVGLMAPHIGRRLVGSSFGALLPVSALLGGVLVLVADLLGRTMFSPLEIPAGVFTAAIGAPYFVYLLFKSRNL